MVPCTKYFAFTCFLLILKDSYERFTDCLSLLFGFCYLIQEPQNTDWLLQQLLNRYHVWQTFPEFQLFHPFSKNLYPHIHNATYLLLLCCAKTAATVESTPPEQAIIALSSIWVLSVSIASSMNAEASNKLGTAVNTIHLFDSFNLIEFVLFQFLGKIIIFQSQHLYCEITCVISTVDTNCSSRHAWW